MHGTTPLLEPVLLYGTTNALIDLVRMLDGLTLLAWLPALAALGAALRVFWLEQTAPRPTFSRWLIPVPMPADLRRVPVAPYGPATRRAAYPAAMARAVLTASTLLPALLLTGLWLATVLLPHHDPLPGGGRFKIIGPLPTPPTELLQAPNQGGSPPPRSPMKDFRSALIVPTRDRSAPPDSLDILSPDDLTVFDPRASVNGPWDGIGTGEDPTGPGYRGTGVEGTEAEPAPVDLAVVDEMPVLVSLPAPRYPEMARQAGVEGRVTLGLLVGRMGRVEQVRVLESIPALDEAARAAALEARFTPARWQHRSVRVWVTMPIRFSLKEAD